MHRDITTERIQEAVEFLQEEYDLAICDGIPVTAEGYKEAKELIEDLVERGS